MGETGSIITGLPHKNLGGGAVAMQRFSDYVGSVFWRVHAVYKGFRIMRAYHAESKKPCALYCFRLDEDTLIVSENLSGIKKEASGYAMGADMTRQEVRFIRWDIPASCQEDLPDPVKNGERGRIDKARCAFTALGETADAFWNGGKRMEYVATMPDGTDGDLLGGSIPKITGTSACYNREWLVKIMSNLTSDYVRIRIDDAGTLMVMMGLVGEKKAAAILTPRIETDVEE